METCCRVKKGKGDSLTLTALLKFYSDFCINTSAVLNLLATKNPFFFIYPHCEAHDWKESPY